MTETFRSNADELLRITAFRIPADGERYLPRDISPLDLWPKQKVKPTVLTASGPPNEKDHMQCLIVEPVTRSYIVEVRLTEEQFEKISQFEYNRSDTKEFSYAVVRAIREGRYREEQGE